MLESEKTLQLLEELARSAARPTGIEWWLQVVLLPGCMVLLTGALVAVTIYYARKTAEIASLTAQSVKTAEDMSVQTHQLAQETKRMADETATIAKLSRENYLASLYQNVSFDFPTVQSKGTDRRVVVELRNEGVFHLKWVALRADLLNTQTRKRDGVVEIEFEEEVISRGIARQGLHWTEDKDHSNLQVELVDVADQR